MAPTETLLCILGLEDDSSEEDMVRAVCGLITQRDAYRERLTQASVSLYRGLCDSHKRIRELEKQLAKQNTGGT